MSEDTFKKIFSTNLKYYLEINNKTQVDLVNDLGFDKSTVPTWVNGTRLPRMDKVDMLSKYFNINRSDLIEEKSDSQNESTYYTNDETREIAQEIYENPDLRSLFDVAKDIPADRLKAHIEFMKNLKDSEK